MKTSIHSFKVPLVVEIGDESVTSVRDQVLDDKMMWRIQEFSTFYGNKYCIRHTELLGACLAVYM